MSQQQSRTFWLLAAWCLRVWEIDVDKQHNWLNKTQNVPKVFFFWHVCSVWFDTQRYYLTIKTFSCLLFSIRSIAGRKKKRSSDFSTNRDFDRPNLKQWLLLIEPSWHWFCCVTLKQLSALQEDEVKCVEVEAFFAHVCNVITTTFDV